MASRLHDEPAMLENARSAAQDLRERRQTLREALPPLLPLAAKVAWVHADHDPCVEKVNVLLGALAERLTDHFAREDRLWPLHPNAHVGTAEAVLIKADHAEVLDLLHELHAAAGGYVAPDWACGSYHRLLFGLERLHAELFLQMELENETLSS